MALATSSFYGGQTSQQHSLGVETSECNILNGGTAINNPTPSLSHTSRGPPTTSLVHLHSSSHNGSPVPQGYTNATFAGHEDSPGGQSPNVEKKDEGTVTTLKECKGVDVTPEVVPICGGEGGEKETEKPKEVRKLFPLFDMTTWARQAQQAGHTSSRIVKGNAPSRKRWVEEHEVYLLRNCVQQSSIGSSLADQE